MRRCVNPMCFQGDLGDPLEYVSDNAVDCYQCGDEIDLDDDPYYESEIGVLCEGCAKELDETP